LSTANQPIPKTLRQYGHDLESLAAAVAPYYPPVKRLIDGHDIANLNEHYWGGGNRDYEYPEGYDCVSVLTPLDELAGFIRSMHSALMDAITASGGGATSIEIKFQIRLMSLYKSLP